MALMIRVLTAQQAQKIAKIDRKMVHCQVAIESVGAPVIPPYKRWGWLTMDDADPQVFVGSNGECFKAPGLCFKELQRCKRQDNH